MVVAGPLLVAAVLAVATTALHRRLPPRLATAFVTATLVLVVVAAIPTLLVLTLAFAAHVPLIGTGARWCGHAMGVHADVPAWIGLPAAAALVWGAARVVRLVRDHRRLRCDRPGQVHLAADRRPYAVTLPGTGGQIVLSQGLVELLSPAEREVVLAHEQAHARHRHDRFLLAAELAAAALPVLRPLAGRVAYSLERWADDVAARACGNRRLVAETLGKVALHGLAPSAAGFAGLGVAARVRALLDPPVRRPGHGVVGALWSSVVVTALLVLYQFHHLQVLAAALCAH